MLASITRMNSFAMASSNTLTCSKFHGQSTRQLLGNLPFLLLPTDECSKRLLDEIREIANAYLVRATKAHRTNVQIKAMSDDIVMAVEGSISGKYASADAIEDVLDELSVADSLAIAMSDQDVIPAKIASLNGPLNWSTAASLEDSASFFFFFLFDKQLFSPREVNRHFNIS